MHQDPRYRTQRPAPPYGQPYPMQHGHVVSRTGLSSGAHTAHLILTVLSCGFWSPIWIIHALLARRKTVTRY
jgi:hypothetical protein